jgi:voltage-gated potassium channel
MSLIPTDPLAPVPGPLDPQTPPGLHAARPTGLRGRVYAIIFETETPGGRLFDVVLIWAILLSVGIVLLESVQSVRAAGHGFFEVLEWIFTLLFTVEYALRLYAQPRRLAYARSFFGIVDLLAVLPTYLSLFFPGLHAFGVIRMFRLPRLFRIFKLLRYMDEARVLGLALKSAQPKITVFLTTLAGIVVSLGALMYLVEGSGSGFTSIPKGIYWAIITVTTVGYGDLVPRTVLGQAIASVTMILGYAIIAVPTGIVSAEWTRATRTVDQEGKRDEAARYCAVCGHPGSLHANYCAHCGAGFDSGG